MIILKGVIAIITLFIVPELLGLFVLKFWNKEKNNIILAFILGYLIEFAVGELVSVPMIFKGTSFVSLIYVYVAIIGFISIVSFILNVKRFKEIYLENKETLKKIPKVLTIILVLLIALQIFVYIKYAHIDDDDAYYVGTATTSVQTNTLYKYSARTGNTEDGENLILRYRLGPFPVFYAIISVLLSIHPAIVAHFILPIIFVPIVYMIYYLIAKKLFKENEKSTILFMILIAVLHIFGNYSIRNNFTFMLFRIWQGKSLLANMIIPSIWLLFIFAEENNFKFINYLLLFITILAGNFVTTMGIALPPLVLMLLIITHELSKFDYKNIKNNRFRKIFLHLINGLICCIPSIVCGIIYFI